MVRVVGQRAHSFRSHIEQVRGLDRRVGNADACASTAVDQDRFDPAPGELRGENCA